MITDVSPALLSYLRRKLIAWGKSQFHALIAELMLQRTRAEQVVNTYLTFKKRFPDPATLANSEISDIENVIAPLGLLWRARYFSELGKKLCDLNGLIPIDNIELQKLPGVGPYSSAAYLSLHAKQRLPIVDSNIVRFYGRIFGFQTGPETRRMKNMLLLADSVTPRRNFKEFNYSLIDFTRMICKPKPDHSNCPLYRKCVSISR